MSTQCEELTRNFNYGNGPNGPANWANLCPECAQAQQSPINLNMEFEAGANYSLEYNYPSVLAFDVTNNGHTVEVPYNLGSATLINRNSGETTIFNTLQFHFHSPSEHTLDGVHESMEIHMVHQSPDGKLLVVGAFFKLDPTAQPNPALTNIFENIPPTPVEHGPPNIVNVRRPLDIYSLLAEPGAINRPDNYYYVGSLTTPPCTTGVNWFVLNRSNPITQNQLADFQNFYNGNNRPVQPIMTSA